jgi:CTP synthase
MLHDNGFDEVVCRELRLPYRRPELEDWHGMIEKIKARNREVRIAIVGKYTRLHDAYLSIKEALSHAGYEFAAKPELIWVDSEQLTPDNLDGYLRGAQGILVPGGFATGASRG